MEVAAVVPPAGFLPPRRYLERSELRETPAMWWWPCSARHMRLRKLSTWLVQAPSRQ